MITAEELGTTSPELAANTDDPQETPENPIPTTDDPMPTRDGGPDKMSTIATKGVGDRMSALMMPPAYKEVKFEVADVEVGKPYKLNDIKYATNSAELSEASLYILNEFIDYLKENPNIKIAIHGHTDDRGNKADNMALSADRAFSVMEYLQTKGIASNRLAFKGFGPTKPIASNATDDGRAINRRTEFVITAR